jgi:4-hydroxy-3-polyprenylbenzoate decarboxylase
MSNASRRRCIAVGVTGASGVIYAVRTIAALAEQGCRLEIVFSDYGRRLLLDELGPDAKVDRLVDLLVARYGEDVRRGEFVVHSNKDLGATIASGSHRAEAMVIVPCSMKTLAGVANGLSRSLIERAADVMLKERAGSCSCLARRR